MFQFQKKIPDWTEQSVTTFQLNSPPTSNDQQQKLPYFTALLWSPSQTRMWGKTWQLLYETGLKNKTKMLAVALNWRISIQCFIDYSLYHRNYVHVFCVRTQWLRQSSIPTTRINDYQTFSAIGLENKQTVLYKPNLWPFQYRTP